MLGNSVRLNKAVLTLFRASERTFSIASAVSMDRNDGVDSPGFGVGAC